MPRDTLARLRFPAGLDIDARTEEEIALSILAEIVATRSSEKAAASEAATLDAAAVLPSTS